MKRPFQALEAYAQHDKAESRERTRKLERMTPDARAWFYDRELRAREEGDDAWDRFLKAEFAGRALEPK